MTLLDGFAIQDSREIPMLYARQMVDGARTHQPVHVRTSRNWLEPTTAMCFVSTHNLYKFHTYLQHIYIFHCAQIPPQQIQSRDCICIA